MELQELRYFVEIASTGSLSRTAGRLSVSQPTLSRHLSVLEREMRTGLFYRHGRGVQLTEAGRRLFDVATSALRQLEGVKEELQAGGLDEVGEVTVGTPPSIASAVGADLAVAFAAQYPRASLRMREGFSGVLLEWIEAGRLDCAVLYEARRSNNVLCTPLFLEQLFLVESARGATEGPETADIGELAKLPCLLTGPGNGLRRVFDAACWSERVQPHVAMEIDCVAALKLLVERGIGCTVLPFGAVHREVEEDRLRARPFRSPAMRAMLVVATPPHKPVTPMTRATIRLLEAQVDRLAASGVLRGDTRDLSRWSRPPSAPPTDAEGSGAGPAARRG